MKNYDITQNSDINDFVVQDDNLFLAGDWTATGYPATIEGAVMSGRTAAELVG